jgi:uroporphyrinogen decarboxylase
MNYNIFENRKKNETTHKTQIPVWFMRQAGRYHEHYQNLKKNHSFMELCKNSDLATEVTLGPIHDFQFDAAILFSDLLFPLEQLGLGLDYLEGPPRIHHHLLNNEDLKKIKIQNNAQNYYDFQVRALKNLREQLPKDCTLLGFVGSPWTLFAYAAEGSHAGNLISSKSAFYDKRWEVFCDNLLPELSQNMILQAEAGANAVCIFDTAAGELSFLDYQEFVVPKLNWLFKNFKEKLPHKKIFYYSKWTNTSFFKQLDLNSIDVLGVDWRLDLCEVIKTLPSHLYIQGNIDPVWLHLPWNNLEIKLHNYFNYLKRNNFPFHRWICGLGHGVIIKTPEFNVRKTVEYIHQNWHY